MPKSSKPYVCIVGSRSINDVNLDLFIDPDHIGCVETGGASGVDALAEQWANRHHIECIIFKAHWEKFGKRAGILRNRDMVEFSDAVIAFWDGRSKGTQSTIEYAQKLGVPCYIHLVQNLD